ncbi:MAG TPA: VOC family protein [Aliidongia sp.]|nr:VOC family protein [Aliidongia sp.]
MAATGMEHFTVLAQDLDGTVDFYRDLLGLETGPRPPFDFPGAWLYCGGRAVLHVVGGRSLPAQRHGVIDHMAFAAQDLAGTVERLKARGVEYDLRRLAGGGLWQMFFLDPNGAKVELDFPASEAAPG